MARKRSNLSSRTSRAALPVSDQPIWEVIGKGIRLGYRRGIRGGSWLVATRKPDGSRLQEKLGKADDTATADGKLVLDHDQAKAAARQRVKGILNNKPVLARFTVNDVLDSYFEAKKAEMKSHKDSKQRAALHIRPVLGKIAVEALTTDKIRKWRDDMANSQPRKRPRMFSKASKVKKTKAAEEKKVAPPLNLRKRRDSANRILTVLKAALNWAYNEGLIADDHEWRRAKPFRQTSSSRIRFLDNAEQKRLLNSCQGSLRNLVAAALMTGARFGELARLEVRDYNFETKKLFIAESKSGKSRYIPLAVNGAAFFDQITVGRLPKDRLLTTESGLAWTKNSYQRDFVEALAHAKIDRLTLHELRHTYASTMVRAGAPLIIVAQALGHADTRMAEKHYAHIDDDYADKTIRETAPDLIVENKGTVTKIANIRK